MSMNSIEIADGTRIEDLNEIKVLTEVKPRLPK